ncbi:MAG: sulfatase-like hydrolase/transferase [Firmicutes bacterium]|nr:sulfatase-like hydrolase/transferase [Bacillota bacterium]
MRARLWLPAFLVTVILPLFALLPHLSGPAGFVSSLADRPVPLVSGPGTGPFTAVYLIVVDGLRYDVAHSTAMPFLRGLKQTAAWGKVRVGLPSYSRPGYARLLTGASTELTGLTMNEQTKAAPVPTVFSLAREAGLSTAASAHYWVKELVEGTSGPAEGFFRGRFIQYGYFYRQDDEPDARVFANAKEIVRLDHPWLVLVLPPSVDAAGHQKGGRSPAYRKAAAAVDELLADFYHSLPRGEKHLVIVTADHGHRDAGGHGGEERDACEVPLFLLGEGVRPGRMKSTIDQLDIVPTIAAALGLPMAGSMGGRVLVEAFAEEGPWASAQARLAKAQEAYLQANSDFFSAWRSGSGLSFAEVWRRTRERALWRGAFRRLPLALLLGGSVLVLFFRFLFSTRTRWPVLAGLAFPLYFYAFFRLLGADYSYSVMHSAGHFLGRVLIAAGMALAVSTWAGASLRREGEGFLPSLVVGLWTVENVLFFISWTVAGGGLRGFLPDLGWHVFFLVQAVLLPLTSLYALFGWWYELGIKKKRPREVPVST